MNSSDFEEVKADFDSIIEKIMNGEKNLSFSSFINFFLSPRNFFSKMMFKKQTPAMLEGMQFHMCCLEPEKYNNTFTVLDDAEKIKDIGGAKPRSTAKYKAWYKEQLELIEKQGKQIISIENDIKFRSMSKYIRNNTMTKFYLDECNNPESSHYFEFGGFKWRGIIDEMCDMYTLDLKKMKDVSDKRIVWTCKDEFLDYQGALYSIPAQTNKHIILAIDNDHNINAIEVADQRIEFCLHRLEYFTAKFRECAETDSWNEGKNFFEKQPLFIN